MVRRLLGAFAVAIVALTGSLIGQTKQEAGKEIFGASKVWALHLEIPAQEYEAMQPKGGFGVPGKPPAPSKDKGGDKRGSEKNLFGTEFPWAQGELSANDKKIGKAGIRYDGNGSYFASAKSLKRPLKVDFQRFGKADFEGLKAINLGSGALDPTRGRETLAYAIFRAAGVPAPRTALAEVTLTVPGKYDKELLGLYTLVESVDATFLKDRFESENGLLMKPARLRGGIDFLGEEWDKYKGLYQPVGEATKEQSARVVAFAKLVNQGTDEQFQKEIADYLDVDQFLRFLAANALLANMDSFFTLGQNYHLYLHPKTNKFHFFPLDLDQSMVGLAMMGSPDQLLDLSVTRPYAGPNKLTDRLLATKQVSEKYQKVLKDLASNVFTKERLVKDIESLEKACKDIVAREAKATAARKEGPGGFGPGGGMFGQPPDLRKFAEKRTESVLAQLGGTSKGFTPQPFNFGPGAGFPGGKGKDVAVNDKTLPDLVQAPADFNVTLFGAPPQVNYPVAIAAAPTGEVFIAVDEQGSLGKTAGGGKILRCLDKDGDGKMDQVTVFAKMEHPRGVICQGNTVWVMHPPMLSVYHDDDGDGIADRHEVLVTGLTTDQIDKRGGDHTTNGIRLGIDGWIYIGVGDYGIQQAKGKDGTTISLRGGGVVRVRPDGTEMEIYATGLRNPFDLAIDPYMNLFTRDNTNDGAGWDIRVSHLMQTAQYGYTQLYANFPEEIMPTLGSFGGGGGTGGLFAQDPRWPEKYRDTLFTGDWGRSEVYRHALKKNGPTFDLEQEVFVKIPRPTGMDADGNGNLYVASWRGGESAVYLGPNIGFVVRLSPRDVKTTPAPSLKDAKLDQLITQLTGANSVARQAAQREILRRGRNPEATKALVKMTADASVALPGRVIGLYTLKQLDGLDSQAALLKLGGDIALRPYTLRALTDRKGELAGLDPKVFRSALADASPDVRTQAIISLVRLNDTAAAPGILPLTTRPTGTAMPTKKPIHQQPDPDRVIPHLAMRALVSLNAVDVCLNALDGPHRDGALLALRSMHDKKAVEGLIQKLGNARSTELRRGILATLVRLYHREAEYKGSWWGIRPDSTGPYYDREEWDLSKRVGAVVTSAVLDSDLSTATFLRGELSRHKVVLKGLPTSPENIVREKEIPIVVPKADPKNPNQIGNLSFDAASARALKAKGDAAKGKLLFKAQSCVACHTDADGQTPKGPHLVDIGKRYSPTELIESILKPSAKLAQGYESYTFTLADGKVLTGFVVSEAAATVQIREANGVHRELKRTDIESRELQKQSMMPDGIVSNLMPEQLADLIAYLRSLE